MKEFVADWDGGNEHGRVRPANAWSPPVEHNRGLCADA
jgi:hypothetical protein